MFFIASGNLFSDANESYIKYLSLEKHDKMKMWSLVKLQRFSLRALLKKSMLFT